MIDYIGLPYDIRNESGVNCWGLVAKVYHDKFSVDIDDYPSNAGIREIAATFTAAFANDTHGFIKVDDRKDFDVVIFKKATKFGFSFHCGIWLDGKVLHASSRSKSVVYELLSLASYGFEEIEFWRQ